MHKNKEALHQKRMNIYFSKQFKESQWGSHGDNYS